MLNVHGLFEVSFTTGAPPAASSSGKVVGSSVKIGVAAACLISSWSVLLDSACVKVTVALRGVKLSFVDTVNVTGSSVPATPSFTEEVTHGASEGMLNVHDLLEVSFTAGAPPAAGISATVVGSSVKIGVAAACLISS